MRHRVILSATTLLALGVASSFLLRYERVHAQGGRTAYTITKISKMSDATGVKEVDTDVIATKANGSRALRSIRSLPFAPAKNQSVEYRDVVDTVSRKEISLEMVSNSKATFPLSAKEVASRRDPPDRSCTTRVPSDAVIDSSPEPSDILGYSVVKITLRKTLPIGSTTIEKWVAPDLDCETLREANSLEAPDGSTHSTTREVIAISLGEPNEALFTIPHDAVERLPSQMLAEIAKIRGEQCAACNTKAAAQFDSNYLHRKSRATQ